MKSSALIFWVALAIVGSAAYGSWLALRNSQDIPRRHSVAESSVAFHPLPPPGEKIKDFQLVERSGREFDSKELAGHVWVGSFFFCNCPGPCWQMNQGLKGVETEFKDTDLRLVSITCDPKNDTPEALSRYADRLQADPYRWQFLTGDLNYLKRISLDVFKLPVEEGGHYKSALVIDRAGKVRDSFDLVDPTKIAELKALVRKLLAEKPEPAMESDTTAAPSKDAEVIPKLANEKSAG